MIEPTAAWAALCLAGILIHLFADWFLQNDWMATNKARRWYPKIHMANWHWVHDDWDAPGWWWLRHPAAYVHAGIHTALLLLVFPVWAALIVGVLHLIIDTRSPLEWWGKFTRQTRPSKHFVATGYAEVSELPPDLMDIGMEVAFWRDQVAHIVVIALVAALV